MVAHDLPSTWGTEKGEQQQKYPINLKAFSSGNGIFHSLSYNSEIQRVCSTACPQALTLLLCFGNLILLFFGQVIFSRVKRFSLLRVGSELCARVSWIYFRWLWFCQQYYRFLITFVLYLEHPLHQRKHFPSFTIGKRRFQKLEERDWGVDPEVSL